MAANLTQPPLLRKPPSEVKFSVDPKAFKPLTPNLDTVGARPSILLPHLQENEKKFFELVHSGMVNDTASFLESNPDFNINCVDFQGTSALLIAVRSHSEEMVKFLLSRPGIDIGDAALHAIRDNEMRILILLLDKLNEAAPGLEYHGATHSADFPDHVTPLSLAAQCGHYEIVDLLMKRGHKITKPHSPSCRCNDCRIHLQRDDLLHAESLRMNLYRAVSNPAYICHSTIDPILAAFQLSVELSECAQLVPEFRVVYNQLSNEVSAFAVDLIGCCRTTSEVELILKQNGGITGNTQFLFPRLILAMDFKQKSFVAHPNTQQVVESAWHGNWHEYKLKSFVVKLFYPVIRIVTLPFVKIITTVAPKSKLGVFYRIPLNKMISHTAGYIVFLILIFLESNIDKTNQKRLPPNSGLELFIIVFVMGHIFGSIRICLLEGPKRYFKSMWNWHSLITNMLFVLTFFFWLASYIDAKQNDQIYLERKYWHSLDPVLISEGTFAVATIMAYFRLMYFCRLNYYMGPLQISLGKMGADMAKYVSIFIIIIISFSVGMCTFYQYYDGMVQVDSSGMKTQQVSSFVNFATTLKTFFWALFCMSDIASADVIIENLPGETEKTTIINKHNFTEAVGFIVFALFEILTVIMILNMLIATMSATFQRVIDNLDIEWTFGKTDFYLEYMLESTTPSPLNLIPTPRCITKFMNLLKKDQEIDPGLDLEYPALMSTLAQRYFREKSEVASSDIDVLRQEVSEIQRLLKDIIEATR